MATTTMPLPLSALATPGGEATPVLHTITTAASALRPEAMTLGFGSAATPRAWLDLTLPTDFDGSPIVRLRWMSVSTQTLRCVWSVALRAAQEGVPTPATGPSLEVVGSVATSPSPSESRGAVDVAVVPPPDAGLVAGGPATLLIVRDTELAADTLSADAELLSASIDYTQTQGD